MRFAEAVQSLHKELWSHRCYTRMNRHPQHKKKTSPPPPILTITVYHKVNSKHVALEDGAAVLMLEMGFSRAFGSYTTIVWRFMGVL